MALPVAEPGHLGNAGQGMHDSVIDRQALHASA